MKDHSKRYCNFSGTPAQMQSCFAYAAIQQSPGGTSMYQAYQCARPHEAVSGFGY